MEEPSVLDYLKSKLKFWQRGGKVEIPPEPEGQAVLPGGEATRARVAPAVSVAPVKTASFSLKDFPWRSLLALAFILLAQRTFEPSPARTATPGLILYGIGLAWLVLAYLRGEWKLADLPVEGPGNDTLRVRLVPLVLAIFFSVAAFISLGSIRLSWKIFEIFQDNLFTWWNVSLWLLAIIFYIWAFWSPSSKARLDKVDAVENSPTVTGNILLNDKLNGLARVVSAYQHDLPINIGAAFQTLQGGTIIINANGDYRYTSPVWNNVPPGGIKEIILYTIVDENGATSSSRLIVEVSDSDLVIADRPMWKRLATFLRRESWLITLTKWSLLLLAVTGLVVFFRAYDINGVPSEPFSDHAEKILDVYEVTQGQTRIFFPRNTGREAIQMYLTVAVSWLFGTGLSFLSLKIGTVICGLATLPYIYLLGKELGGKRVALLALLFAGIAYWPNVIARDGLRFPLYPLFVAPTLFYLLRGLRTRSRNDFILSGIALGIGLHGYSPIRILPFVVVIAIGLYLLHAQSKGARKQAIAWLAILALVSLILFLPLLRYWLEFPDSFAFRAFSRLGSTDTPLPAPAWQVFLSNLWNALKMFNWDDGEIWVHSVTHRPALDVVSGALFLAGALLLLVRYIKSRNWVDLFLLLSIPLLQMPSILSLAFPAENPALNRAGGAMVPVFVIVALALDGLWTGIRSRLTGRGGAILTWSLSLLLVGLSVFQNYDLVFNQFAQQFDGGAWNTSEMGAVIKQFDSTYGTTDTVWIVPYPHWVDTRLPGVWAGIPDRDFGVWPENLETTLEASGPKLFIVNVEDETGKARLEELYLQGIWSRFTSATGLEGKDFLIYFVPSEE